VIGVAPPQFKGMVPGLTPELWIPSMMVEEVNPAGIQDTVPSPTGRTRIEQRGSRWMFVRGRLKPGVTRAQAQANVDVVMARLEREHAQTNKNRRVAVTPGSRIHPQVDAGLGPVAALVMAVVGVVLLVACANVANMLLARAAARRREVGIRLAVGVARGRLIRQLLTESAVIALLGGAAGLALAYWCNQLLLSIQPPFAAILTLDLGFDSRVLLFALTAAIATGVIFGLAPALQASRLDLVAILKDDGSAARGERRRFGLRQTLVVAQVAVSMVLLVAGGLLVRSLSAARAADLGFPIDRLATSSLDLSMARYSRERAEVFWRQLDERLRARPEIASVALASRYPLSVNFNTTQVFVDGQPNGADDQGYVIDANRVSPGYFRTLGVALLEGRDLSEADTVQSPPVAVVTKAFASRFWPNESAVGKRVRTRVATGPVVEIVGVVADHKVRTIGESPRPVIHLARAQQFAPYATIIVQGRGDAAAASAALQRELLALEPGLLLIDHQPMRAALGSILFPSRVGAILLGAFGLLALALAAIGLYGVIAYSVSRRTREIGLRMALGASAPRVLRQVLGQGFLLVGAGVAAGGLLALGATRILASALYGVGAADPVAYLLAAGLLAAVAAAANLVPAIRAARVDPLTALRQN
jgi:predicted permease